MGEVSAQDRTRKAGMMGFIRKTMRAGGALTVGVPLAHKRSKKDRLVRAAEQQAEALQAMTPPPPPPPTQWTPTPLPPVPPPPPLTIADQLERIAQLHQQGMLSDDEYTAAKAQLLTQ